MKLFVKSLALLLVVCVAVFAFVGCGKKEETQTSNEPANQTETSNEQQTETTNTPVESTEVEAAPVEEVDVPKDQQEGTAGSNIPIKDNMADAEYEIQRAFAEWLGETYGDSVFDARVHVKKIYTAEEEAADESLKAYNLGPDELAFEVEYELKPAAGTDVNALTAANGVYDEESDWVTEKYNVGILRPTKSGDFKYEVTDIGTGF